MATILIDKFENSDGDNILKLQQDGIDFNNVYTNSMPVSSIIGKTNSYTTGGSAQYPIINAVDIDWNNAKLGETIIDTTGKLLSCMNTIVQKSENLENILINL